MAEFKYGDVLRRPPDTLAEIGSPEDRVMFVCWEEDGPPDDRPFVALGLAGNANGIADGDIGGGYWTPWWEVTR